MTIWHTILFTMRISHTYYAASCQDFDFLLPSGTMQLLSKGKLIAKTIGGVLNVLFEADQAGEALIPIEGKTLRIGLRLRNPFFSNITDLSSMATASTLLYQNAVSPDALDTPRETVLVGRLFSHSIVSRERPVTVVLKNADGQTEQTNAITVADNRSTISYELIGLPAGVYSVEETGAGPVKQVRYYVDAELQQYGCFGIIEIVIARSFYTAHPEFTIPFNAKKDILKYYIVAKNYTNAEFAHLAVTDKGAAEDGRPKINFTKVPSSAFTIEDLSPALLGGSSVNVVLFKSQGSVARQERARKKIELSKNGDILVKHLPQPGADKSSGYVIVQISKP